MNVKTSNQGTNSSTQTDYIPSRDVSKYYPDIDIPCPKRVDADEILAWQMFRAVQSVIVQESPYYKQPKDFSDDDRRKKSMAISYGSALPYSTCWIAPESSQQSDQIERYSDRIKAGNRKTTRLTLSDIIDNTDFFPDELLGNLNTANLNVGKSKQIRKIIDLEAFIDLTIKGTGVSEGGSIDKIDKIDKEFSENNTSKFLDSEDAIPEEEEEEDFGDDDDNDYGDTYFDNGEDDDYADDYADEGYF